MTLSEVLREKVFKPRSPGREALIFALVMWGLSRGVVLLGLLAIAPLLPTPSSGEVATWGWEAFNHWDSKHYEQIVTEGYQFKNDGKGYNVAFFPLFPLLIWGAMHLGLPFDVAGTLINNLAFLGALVMLYLWIAERHGRSVARWSTAVLAWCPFSLFSTVIYTEGLFLLGSVAALRAFDRQQYVWAMLWGALTTALRPPGIALVLTFLWAAWRERRGAIAYLTALVSSTGLLLYMLYGWLHFHQPLAFALAQRGWQSNYRFWGGAWLNLATTVLWGPVNKHKGSLVDPIYPLAMLLIVALGILLWRSRHQLGFPKTGYGFCILVILLWLVGGSPLITATMAIGSGYLLWHFRQDLGCIALSYGLFSWAIILSTGRTTSSERYIYGMVTMAIAFGLLLSRSPRWGYATLIFFTILLGNLSVRFAQGLWAG